MRTWVNRHSTRDFFYVKKSPAGERKSCRRDNLLETWRRRQTGPYFLCMSLPLCTLVYIRNALASRPLEGFACSFSMSPHKAIQSHGPSEVTNVTSRNRHLYPALVYDDVARGVVGLGLARHEEEADYRHHCPHLHVRNPTLVKPARWLGTERAGGMRAAS
jgi:hypothetical protein